jgi:hypothetical protein
VNSIWTRPASGAAAATDPAVSGGAGAVAPAVAPGAPAESARRAPPIYRRLALTSGSYAGTGSAA